MQSELSRSQFAQETLGECIPLSILSKANRTEQSTAAISSLSESYSSLDTLLSSSRSLANSLLRSQKSDTWYLETAFYILLATIGWLLFRRVFYGPLWWLVWQPLKLVARVMFAAGGAVGLSSTSVQSASESFVGVSSAIQDTATAVVTGTMTSASTAWNHEPSPIDSDRVIDKIGQMVEESEGSAIDDITPEERARQEALPRNPKKRMFEAEVEQVRDEL
jgi:hypothetical protein